MNRIRHFLLALALGSATLVQARSAAELYAQRDYKAAATQYEQQLQSLGDHSGLLYNLASCYYQLGDLGHARLYIERSLSLDPRNSAALANRQLIISKTVDKLPDGRSWIAQTGERMAYALPLGAWITISLLGFALAIGAFVAFRLSQSRSQRLWTFYSSVSALALSLFSLALILHWVHEYQEAERKVVLLLPEVIAYDGEAADAQEVMKLHEGTLLYRTGQSPLASSQRLEVELPEGRRLWIERSALEFVRPSTLAGDKAME